MSHLKNHLKKYSNISTPRALGTIVSVLSLCLAANIANAGVYTNFIGIKITDLPAGNFQMGSCKITKKIKKMNRKRKFLDLPLLSSGCIGNNQNVSDNETPQHNVNIKAFALGITPVTLGQYQKYLDAIGVQDAATGWNLINDEFKRLNSFGNNAPVVQVSWSEAREFLDWLNENKPADDPYTYRFASEAEWEYACRAGSDHKYCGSNNLGDVGWVDLSKNANQHEVATKAPNAWGIYDMTGNAWEWVRDTYHENYVGAPTDGSAWITHTEANKPSLIVDRNNEMRPARAMHVSSNFTAEQREFDKANQGAEWQRDTGYSRVLRGGSWRFGTEMARATYRLSGEPGNWYYGNGFRVAATLTSADKSEK